MGGWLVHWSQPELPGNEGGLFFKVLVVFFKVLFFFVNVRLVGWVGGWFIGLSRNCLEMKRGFFLRFWLFFFKVLVVFL